MPIAKLKNIEMYYEIHGQGNPLVLIAGYTCDHTFWVSILEMLSKYFQVLIFDNRAIGQTKDTNVPLNIEMFAEDTMSLIQYLGIDQPIIIGQSMGGAIAQAIAMKYPEKIKKLIILNSVAKFNFITLMALENILTLRKTNISIDLLTDITLPWIFSGEYLNIPEHINNIKTATKKNIYPQSLSDEQRQFDALKKFDSTEWVNNIKIPTLVMAGENDLITPISECQNLAKFIKNSKFETIPGGHASPIEQPARLNESILNFINY